MFNPTHTYFLSLSFKKAQSIIKDAFFIIKY